MPNQVSELPAERLRRVCDPSVFGFQTTEELPELTEIIGQDRAVSAVSFGIDIESPGYHMYALGPVGTGKTTTIRKFLSRRAVDPTVPDDWCYVNDFHNVDRPKALSLPAGRGARFKAAMDRFVEELKVEVPRVLESEEYQEEHERVEDEFRSRRQELFQELRQEAESRGFALVQTPQGIGMAPIVDGNVITPEQFNQLEEEKRRQIEQRQEELQDTVRDTMRRVQQLQREAREQLRKLDQQVVGFAVNHMIEELKRDYAGLEGVVAFLDAVRADILENVETFKQLEQMEQRLEQLRQQMPFAALGVTQETVLDKYRVNLIVDNGQLQGAPVVFESNPSHPNLLGRLEHEAQFGALVTSFTMIKAGALHRANGGYLMVEARNVLSKPFAWEGLKRALKDKEIRIESMGEELRLIATRSLEPEPIPLDVKVIVIGDPLLYYLLYNLDEDFQELFKVKADFAEQMDWDSSSPEKYAQFIGSICREEGLRHFDASGVAKVVEQGARMVANQNKLAVRFGDIVDLVRQANYWAGRNGHHFITAADVMKAMDERTYRSNRIEERIREMIGEGTILIDTEGEAVGQVNGISIVPLGDYTFGKPSRITARTSAGRAGVVNIDREAGLGGKIHNKGVMILSGYLSGRYAEDVPLTLSSTIAFEQLYEEVEGDSASSAELYSLLSSLSGFPIRQGLAVTGSVDQHGQVQAIGGVNEKIEGFFEVCRAKGLTGEQGVIIPAANVRNLMLREEVVEAVREGQFHVYPVSTVDEGIALLTGKEAGERQADGTYPEGTVNRAVQDRLRDLAEKVREFARREEEPVREEASE